MTPVAAVIRNRLLRPKEERDRYNLNQIQVYEALLNRHGGSLRQFKSILDFGCGYGRLTQYLFDLAPEAQVIGCDVSARDIARCRRRYRKGQFLVNQPAPPLPLRDGQCDLIFSYSLFTHLSEPNHKSWLKEFTRILRPGGMMVHSTHSYSALRRMAMFSPERLAPYGLEKTPEEFIALGSGYHYVAYHSSQPEYGLAILSKEYVLSEWPKVTGLKILEYVEEAIQAFPEGCQDLVILGTQRNEIP